MTSVTAAPYTARHAAPQPDRFRKVYAQVRVRIPGPVNAVLDTAAQHRFAVAAALVIVVAGVAVALWWESPRLTGGAGAVVVVYAVVAYHVIQIRRRDEVIKDLQYNLNIANRDLEKLKEGDPSGPTLSLPKIGDMGEWT